MNRDQRVIVVSEAVRSKCGTSPIDIINPKLLVVDTLVCEFAAYTAHYSPTSIMNNGRYPRAPPPSQHCLLVYNSHHRAT